MRLWLALVTTMSCLAAPPGVSAPAPVRLEVSEAEGLSAAQTQQLLAPAAEPIQRCVQGRTGLITLRVSSEGGVLHVTPQSSTVGLDDAARHCAFAALSAVVLDEGGTNAAAPQIPPPGFTSVVTVSW